MARLFSFVLVLLASLTPIISTEGQNLPRLKVKDANFVDPEGRVVLLRGVNLVAKGPDFKLISEPKELDNLSRWGLNLVRLGFNWEAYEPERNEFNQKYLSHYVDVVKQIGEREMYVLVDFHQDGFSRWASGGCGEGFPKWTVPEESRKDPVDQTDPEAISKAGCKNWAMKALLDPKVKKLFGNLYDGTSDVGKGFENMITRVAKEVESFTHVVGFDILNEPVLKSKQNTELRPFYERAGKALRDVIPTAVLFIEPLMTTSAGYLPSFLNKPDLENVVYAPHFYDPLFYYILKGYYIRVVRIQLGIQYRQAKKWASPYFLGEFGAVPRQFGAGNYVDDIYTNLDRLWSSGTQWTYTPFWNDKAKDGWNLEDFAIVGEKGQVRANFDPNRPYVRYVSGTPISAVIDKRKMTLDVKWTSGDHPKGETEIFVPKSFFRDGNHVIETSPGLECGYQANVFLHDVEDRVVCTVKAASQKVSLKMRQTKKKTKKSERSLWTGVGRAGLC